jgi:predicted AAA+ superfamily ATPase
MTLGEWLSALESSFIVYRLRPFFENVGKRLVKSPKLYFSDVGLVVYAGDRRIESEEYDALPFDAFKLPWLP